jgi:hypothetical protein
LHDTSSRDAAKGSVWELTVGRVCHHLKSELQEGERGMLGASAGDAHQDPTEELTAANESIGGASAITHTETLT